MTPTNPHDLTAFFEFVDANHAKHPEGDPMRVGVPGGWDNPVGTWFKLRSSPFSPGVIRVNPDEAELVDHQAACHCISEWLLGAGVWVHKCPVGWFAESTQRWHEAIGRLDCPDDPLAALTAAAKEVGK